MSFPGLSRRTTLGFLRALFVPYRARLADVLDADVLAEETPAGGGASVRQSARGVSFLQAGAGARMRSVEDKAREIVSVLDFGAKGDGITDDTAAFDAAIATGKAVSVPCTTAGYAVRGIRVVDNMQVVGEKSGMSLAPMLIVTASNTAAFYNDADDTVSHGVFENLACRAANGVTGASFYAQSTRTKYSAYFTFRHIETYKNLKTSYIGLFIFALWDRCRDGYLGSGSDSEHGAILALAGSYGQTAQQNVNRIRDSMFFGSFGGAGAIVASFGVLWTIENTNFEALKTRAFAAYNILQVRFSDCWFEDVTAPSIVHAGTYPGTGAASTASLDHCNFVLTGSTPNVVSVDAPGSVALRGNLFNLIGAGVCLCDSSARIGINEDNLAISGAGAAGFFAGTHHDSYLDGRRRINGASDNMVAGMTFQNEGGLAATQGFMSRAGIRVAAAFVTIATSRTGLGGTCVVSGYNPDGGAQMRAIKDWQGAKLRDVVAALNDTGRTMSFRVSGNDLQMKVDTGSLVVFTTMLH